MSTFRPWFLYFCLLMGRLPSPPDHLLNHWEHNGMVCVVSRESVCRLISLSPSSSSSFIWCSCFCFIHHFVMNEWGRNAFSRGEFLVLFKWERDRRRRDKSSSSSWVEKSHCCLEKKKERKKGSCLPHLLRRERETRDLSTRCGSSKVCCSGL